MAQQADRIIQYWENERRSLIGRYEKPTSMRYQPLVAAALRSHPRQLNALARYAGFIDDYQRAITALIDAIENGEILLNHAPPDMIDSHDLVLWRVDIRDHEFWLDEKELPLNRGVPQAFRHYNYILVADLAMAVYTGEDYAGVVSLPTHRITEWASHMASKDDETLAYQTGIHPELVDRFRKDLDRCLDTHVAVASG